MAAKMKLIDVKYSGPGKRTGYLYAELFVKRLPKGVEGPPWAASIDDISKGADSDSTFRVMLDGETIFESRHPDDPDYVRMTNIQMIDAIGRILFPPSTTTNWSLRIERMVMRHVTGVPVPDELPDLGPFSPPGPIIDFGWGRNKPEVPRTVIIDHTGAGAPPMFRKKAEEIRDALALAAPVEQIKVEINGQIETPGYFVVREQGGKEMVFVKLLDMVPPEFRQLRKLPVHDVVFGVGNAMLNNIVFDRFNKS